MDPAAAKAPDLPAILSGYRPLPGVADEVLDPQGRVRPVWAPFLHYLDGLPADDLTHRFARSDQYLRDQGVFFRQYGTDGTQGGTSERAWPLSHVPVLIEEEEWQTISRGLVQRAELLEGVMADLYGSGRLVAEGHLPPELVAGSPEWLRPLVGVAPRSGHFLHFLAFDLGRGPDGTWWVLGDRAGAPSGAGFALENRVATARAFSDFYRDANVHRLASFFRDVRDTMMSLRAEPDSRVAILTPGPLSDTHFEQAYIARYLGFMLLQGEDLAADKGRLMIRTVAGLKPISVLWRRLDSQWADPLELDPTSRLGTPGLVSTLRQGAATLVNALGSGVLETRAFLAFLPAIARHLLDKDLILPNVATWWCGDPVARAEVAAATRALVLSDALTTAQPYDGERRPPSGIAMPDWLASEGATLVAQEAVTLSTTPAFDGGRLVPRPMTIRAFALRTPEGWTIMPGGFARTSQGDDPAAVAMRRGGAAADVWVVSRNPVAATTLLPAATDPYRRPHPGDLPTRAADNLFWLGRYVERAEGLMRLLRAKNRRLAENGGQATALTGELDGLIAAHDVDPDDGIPQGLIDTLDAAVRSAGQVRDRFSPDGWSALADLGKTMRRMAERVEPGDDAARALGALLRKLTGFSGLVHENMYRFLGWRFLELGRHHERALGMAAILAALADPEAPDGALDLAVEIGDSVLTHRRRYAVQTSRETVVDLLALDGRNPRSIQFQLDGIRDQVALLPGAVQAGQLSALSRAVLRAHTELATELPETMTTKRLAEMRGRIAALSDLLTETYLR
jgi:uncharacterized circularly permuted ATP-grasp superfamily protein/uncharacterized alpha-E superfamily protein